MKTKRSNSPFVLDKDFADWYDEDYIIDLLSTMRSEDIHTVVDVLNEYNLLSYVNDTLIRILNEFPEFQSSEIIEAIKQQSLDNEMKQSILTNILYNVDIKNKHFFLTLLGEIGDYYDDSLDFSDRISKLASYFDVNVK